MSELSNITHFQYDFRSPPYYFVMADQYAAEIVNNNFKKEDVKMNEKCIRIK